MVSNPPAWKKCFNNTLLWMFAALCGSAIGSVILLPSKIDKVADKIERSTTANLCIEAWKQDLRPEACSAIFPEETPHDR